MKDRGLKMPVFGQLSKERLETCDYDIQRLFNEVIKYWDCKILEGHRGQEAQHAAFIAKPQRSKVDWPHGKHNSLPSMAVDVAPYPVNWNDYNRLYYFAGFVLGIAKMMKIKIRWGGDWDSDTEVSDNKFNDLVHFEKVSEEITTNV
jgi:peptidoglycan LD-endopeptidase CwlK